MIANRKKNALLKAYVSLPVWGKIVVPVAAFLIFSFLFAMVKNIVFIALLAGVAYLIASGYFYIRDRK